MAKLEKTMFREYDIRGRVSSRELNEKTVEIIACAFGTMLRKKGIKDCIVGYDFRPTSEKFHNQVIKGLNSVGVNVIDIGLCLVPMAYSAQYFYKVRGEAMITASHNPNDWSGFKLGMGYSSTLGPEEVKEVYSLAVSEKFVKGKGRVRRENYKEYYLKDLLSRIKISKKLKIVVNAANGTAAFFAPELFRRAGCQVVEYLTKPDWTFPHYFPNPSLVEMMEETGKQVKKAGADIGLAFDGDGDRLGITDEKGQTIWADKWLILLARQVLEKQPGAKIIFDVKCTQALEEDIKAHGGKPIMWITGHSYIKAKRAKENAPLAGELSGHVFFGKPIYYGFDDGMFTGLKILEYVVQQNKPVSEIIADTPYYISSPTIHVDCPDKVKYKVVDNLTQAFKKDGCRVIDINGARVYFDDGWGLVRASSNLPVLVLRIEAKTKEGFAKITKIFKEKLAKFKDVGKEWKSG